MQTRSTCTVALLALIALGGGCTFLEQLVGAGNGGGGTGTLRVLITDKPYPFDLLEEALITITRVEVGQAEDADEPDEPNEPNDAEDASDDADEAGDDADEAGDDDNGDEDDDEGQWLTIFEGSRSFDLLDLRNGRADLLADAEIPAGTYTQMRLIVTEGQVTLEGGRVFPLRVPSGEQTGIKLHFTFQVQDEQETTLILDVDLSRAFLAIPAGHIDDADTIRGFHFQPSLAMRLIQQLEAGSIAGRVSDPDGNAIAGASVTAFNEDGEEVTTTATADDGTYVLGGLPTGTYRVEVSASGFADASVSDVSVTAGQQTADVNFTLTPG